MQREHGAPQGRATTRWLWRYGLVHRVCVFLCFSTSKPGRVPVRGGVTELSEFWTVSSATRSCVLPSIRFASLIMSRPVNRAQSPAGSRAPSFRRLASAKGGVNAGEGAATGEACYFNA